MIMLWIKAALLDSSKFQEIQHCVDSMTVPADVGRIPRKIETGFSGFKADQFKNWILIYSIPALFNVLPREHLECWRYYVSACRLLCQNFLWHSELNLADAFLIKFCKTVESLYGKDANMHLHSHLKDVLLDFGPIQEFWLFSFERYNGVLGKQPTNNRAIEPQLMHTFLRDNLVNSSLYPDEFKEDFLSFCKKISEPKVVGSLKYAGISSDNLVLPTAYTRAVLSANEITALGQLYMKLTQTDSTAASIFAKYSSLTVNDRLFRSTGKISEVYLLLCWLCGMRIFMALLLLHYQHHLSYLLRQFSGP